MQNKCYYAVQGRRCCTNRKTVCDFLLVINSNGHHISHRFEVISDCCLNFRHFAF